MTKREALYFTTRWKYSGRPGLVSRRISTTAWRSASDSAAYLPLLLLAGQNLPHPLIDRRLRLRRQSVKSGAIDHVTARIAHHAAFQIELSQRTALAVARSLARRTFRVNPELPSTRPSSGHSSTNSR